MARKPETQTMDTDESVQLTRLRAELRLAKSEITRLRPLVSSLRAENSALKGQVTAYTQVIDAFLQRLKINEKV